MFGFSHGDQQQLAESFAGSKGAMISGAAGATAAVTPPEKMAEVAGNWMQLNGIGVLSYAEIISVIGATWCVLLIVDRVIAGYKQLRGRPR